SRYNGTPDAIASTIFRRPGSNDRRPITQATQSHSSPGRWSPSGHANTTHALGGSRCFHFSRRRNRRRRRLIFCAGPTCHRGHFVFYTSDVDRRDHPPHRNPWRYPASNPSVGYARPRLAAGPLLLRHKAHASGSVVCRGTPDACTDRRPSKPATPACSAATSTVPRRSNACAVALSTQLSALHKTSTEYG